MDIKPLDKTEILEADFKEFYKNLLGGSSNLFAELYIKGSYRSF